MLCCIPRKFTGINEVCAKTRKKYYKYCFETIERLRHASAIRSLNEFDVHRRQGRAPAANTINKKYSIPGGMEYF